MATNEESPRVRLQLACALQRLPFAQRWTIARGLVSRQEDAKDANLPLMIWYGIEPLVLSDRSRVMKLLPKIRIPLIREYVARRAASLK